jgi:hypothetical protein
LAPCNQCCSARVSQLCPTGSFASHPRQFFLGWRCSLPDTGSEVTVPVVVVVVGSAAIQHIASHQRQKGPCIYRNIQSKDQISSFPLLTHVSFGMYPWVRWHQQSGITQSLPAPAPILAQGYRASKVPGIRSASPSTPTGISTSGAVPLLAHIAYLRTMPLATGKSASPPIDSPISPVDLAPFRAEEGREGRDVVDLRGLPRGGVSG